MQDQSLAQSERAAGYILRGLGLLEAYRGEFRYLGAGRWWVPSGSEEGRGYEVKPGRNPECGCVGFQHYEHCSHVVAAERASKLSAICDSCGERCWYPELVEVQEEDDLLSWIPGGILCRDCIRGGAWS